MKVKSIMAKINSIYSKKELQQVTRGSFVAVKRDNGELESVLLLKDLDVNGFLTPVLDSNFQGRTITAEEVFAIPGGQRLEFEDFSDKEAYDFSVEEEAWKGLHAANEEESKERQDWPYVSLKKAEKFAKKAAKAAKKALKASK